MKKTCNRCQAFECEHGFCSLGYKIKYTRTATVFNGKVTQFVVARGKPLEFCPKPLTIMKYVNMSLGKIPGKAGTLYDKNLQ